MKTAFRTFLIAVALVASAVGVSAQVPAPSKLINISVQVPITDEYTSATAGFVIRGDTVKKVLIRAVGPGLAPFGVTKFNPDPRLTLYNSAGAQIGMSDDWGQFVGDAEATSRVAASVGAFALTPGSNDAALVANLGPGAYTVKVEGARSGDKGIILIEAYDAP
ncbi:MAG TPA: hypothetical protein VGE35_00680 [Candidatus Paceibacterota bacterium]